MGDWVFDIRYSILIIADLPICRFGVCPGDFYAMMGERQPEKEFVMLTKERKVKKRIPTYEIVELFPGQGDWSEAEYLTLDTNRLVELSEGELEVLEMPGNFHQLIIGRLFFVLSLYMKEHKKGFIRFSPLRVRLWPGTIREPDLVFMSAAHADRVGEKYWGIPDLVAEIISESNEEHDRVTKMSEYARAGIPEYWLIDPYARTVEIYLLKGEEYHLAATLTEADALTSSQLPGFAVSVRDLFAEEKF